MRFVQSSSNEVVVCVGPLNWILIESWEKPRVSSWFWEPGHNNQKISTSIFNQFYNIYAYQMK